MINQDKEIQSELLKNLYILSNNKQKKKIQSKKGQKNVYPRANNNLQKITDLGNINKLGSTPIVVFKKAPSKKTSNNFNQINSKNLIYNSKNEYISDGGLSQKIYNNNTNINNNINNIYFNNYIYGQKPIYKNNKNNLNNNNIDNITKKNKERQQIFSKTVREFNKRSEIQKSINSKDLYSKKIKNKSFNNNKNNNKVNFNIKSKNFNKNINGEDSKTQEDKKLNIINQLIENGVVNEIKKLEIKKKSTQKEKNEERKREILENNGMPIDLSDDDEEEKNDSNKNINNKNSNNEEEKNNINILNKKFMSKTTRGFYPKINNFIFPEDNGNEEKKTLLRSKKFKPSVNQFEYINRINNEKKKLNFNSDLSLKNSNINYSNNILEKRKKKLLNAELNDSFRHKNSREEIDNYMNIKRNNLNKQIKIKSKSYNNEIMKKSIDDFYDEFPFSHKKSHRTTEELKKFVKEKKIKNKKKEDAIILEKNKKLFLLFKNLYNLNMKDFSKNNNKTTTNENFYKKTHIPLTASSREKKKASMPKDNNNNIDYNLNKNEKNNFYKNIRKNKEINEYYIGNNSSIQNNNSTLIDPNEYYLNILESQQLVVNSALNKIENNSDFSEENNITNNLNVSKEQNQKITPKESKNSNSIEDINNNLIINNTEFDSLKKKVDNSLKKEGKIFSNKVNERENDTKEDKIKISFSNLEKNEKGKEKNKNIKKKQKNDENIKEIEEKEKGDKAKKENKEKNIILNNVNEVKSPEIKIESSNVEQQKLIDKNTKENNNLPSLSHTYSTNSNQNKKVKIQMEPRAVLNLVEVLKFIIQRKVFVLLYESYIKKAIYFQYDIAFSFLIAIFKLYPFKKIEEYCNYKTYKIAFRHLFKPFMRKAFKTFIKNYFSKRKIEYLVLFLKKLLQSKIFAKIIDYSKFRKNSIQKNNKNIIPFIRILKNAVLKSNFSELKNKIISKNEIIKENNNSNIIEGKLKKIKIEDIKENKNINKNENDDSFNLSENENNHKRKNDSSIKMNSYLYESFGSDSQSLSLEPNSEDNDRLHQLRMMLLIKSNYGNLDSSHDSNSNSYRNQISNDNQSPHSNLNSISKTLNNSNKISNNALIAEQINPEGNCLDDEDLFLVKGNKEKNNIINKEETINNKQTKKDKLFEKDDLNEENYKTLKKDIKNLDDAKEKKDSVDLKEDEKEEKGLNALKNELKQEKSRNLKQEEKPEINIKNEIKKIQEDIKNEKNKLNENEQKELEDNKPEIEIIKELDKNNQVEKEKENEKMKEKEDEEKEKEREREREREKERIRELFSKKVKEIENPEKFSNELTEKILKILLSSEIQNSKKKLIPTKKFKFDKFDKMNSHNNSLNNSFGSAGNTHENLSKEFGISGLSQLSLADELLSLNDSIMSNYSANSVFNKTIKEKKKEKTLNLYLHDIAPKLIKLIRKEIIQKYPLIYENISTPMKNNSEKLMMSLALQDAELLKNNYKSTKDLVSIDQILDKEKILKTFEPINKKIRYNDNSISDNFYDNILNECIVETAIEIINKERLYGKNGDPLKWSSRTHELSFKYKKDDPKKLANFVCKKLYFVIRNKIGLITDNYDNMNPDQLNYERDKRLTNIIKRDFDEYEYQWNNLEMEETQLKVEIGEAIMDQLYNEVIEILEHVQYSRLRPDLYHNKSIYACEEIPKLDFQMTTNEDANAPEGNNDMINI